MKNDMSFVGILGKTPRVKMWEFFLLSRGNFEYNIKKLAKATNITRPTCYKELEELMKRKIIIKGQKHRGKQLYKLNKNLEVVKAMLQAFHKLIYS